MADTGAIEEERRTMMRIRLTVATTLVLHFAAMAPAEVTFDWAYVGNAGNAPDPETGFGSVGYDYRISKTEVTNAQYVEFLNAVDPTGANTLSLYNPFPFGGLRAIDNDGTEDGNRYLVLPGREQAPVAHVSFIDAMRFTNWLHNGQGSEGTEGGVYDIRDGLSEVRSAGATYWIPSEDEWYKAAYHDASAGTAGVYFDYANGSDIPPVSDRPGDDPTAANYFDWDDDPDNGFNDGHAATGTVVLPIDSSPYTAVGAYTNAVSPYGTFDQTGNVSEWNELLSDSAFRGIRGGSWNDISPLLRAAQRGRRGPGLEGSGTGFRVATLVPEPTSTALALIAAAGLTRRRPLGRDHRRTA